MQRANHLLGEVIYVSVEGFNEESQSWYQVYAQNIGQSQSFAIICSNHQCSCAGLVGDDGQLLIGLPSYIDCIQPVPCSDCLYLKYDLSHTVRTLQNRKHSQVTSANLSHYIAHNTPPIGGGANPDYSQSSTRDGKGNSPMS